MVRLADVATVYIAPAQRVIYRENDSRRIDVGAEVTGADLGAVMKEVNHRLSSEQLTAAHARALEEEQHAYQVSKDVYGQTPPSQ